MRVLIETRMNSLKLNESKTPKKGCLGRLEGVCADFKNPTRNGRLYPLPLWKKVFDDALFKEALQNKTLFGELDHPEDRFEPLISEACVVMTDYTIDENKGLIYGGFDILDTPKGRILKSILDYGSVVGVSSRGQGDIIESTDGERVDEDSYEFACFDVVSTPAVEKARQKVMESIKRVKDISFKESIDKQIKDAETITDLNIIRSVVRSSGISDSEMDTIIESIEDRCNNLQDVDKTIVTGEDITKETTLKESAKTIRDKKQLYNCIKSLRSQVSAYKHRESRYLDMLSEKDEMLDSLKESLHSARNNVLESVRKRATNTNNLSEKLKKSSRVINSLNEEVSVLNDSMTNMKKALNDLRLDKKQLTENLNQTIKKNKSLEASYQLKVDNLEEQLQKANNRISYFENQTKLQENNHAQEIQSLDKEVTEYDTLLQEAQDKLNNKTQHIKSLNESITKLSENIEKQKELNKFLQTQLNSYQKGYISKVSNIQGVDEKLITESISNKTTPQQIDDMVNTVRDKMDRYSKFPITNYNINTSDVLIENINNDTEENKEDQRLFDFVVAASKSL